MIKLERLTNSNWQHFIELHKVSEVKHPYDKNFINYYKKQNFLTKSLVKKFVKLFKYEDEYIGFIWHEPSLDINVKIWSFYIKEQYLESLDETVLHQFDNSILSYEAICNEQDINILNRLGFVEAQSTILMKLNTNEYDNTKECEELILKLKNDKRIIEKYSKLNNIDKCLDNVNINIKLYKDNEDEGLRCVVQNLIFQSKDREMLTVDDIFNDTKQDYYIKDMSVFIFVENMAVGFAQIIHSRELNTLVNFGLIPEFRGCGLSKLLLNGIINTATSKQIDDINLRVDIYNKNAINLYLWAGFKEVCSISSFERSK